MARIEVWRPLELVRDDTQRDTRNLWVTARLAPGSTLQDARVQADAIAAALQQEFPQTNGGWLPQIQTFNQGLADDSFWTILWLLTVTVGFVMLIACSNVATMMLARASVRAREIAVRAALGAGRLRILRQLLT